MKSIPIPFDEKLLADIDKVSKPLGLELARVVEAALHAWLKRHESRRFGQEWIAALKKNPDEAGRAEEWLDAQAWSDP